MKQAPTSPDSNGNCPGGSEKDPITGQCISTCSDGKYFNGLSCECPNGQIEDDNGKCINMEDFKIDNNLTNPCAKDIFTQLEIEMIKKDLLQKLMFPNKNIKLTFSEEILKLFNDSKIFKLSIQNNNSLDNNVNASTNGASITLNDSYLRNATQLSITRTIIHEIVHAYLNLRYNNYMSLDKGIDFKNKMEDFAKDNGYKPNGTPTEKNRFQHEFMGQFVSAIAISLANWDVKYGTGGIKIKDSSGDNILDWTYYKNLAYGGLYYNDSNNKQIETDTFISLVPNLNDRNKIKNILMNEQDGNHSSKGTECN
ncbi:trypsin inhibitor-like cysteine-rich domain-containing protein [Pseudotamlana agarivorans]|uniref:trypsin inhibitor-like cysteine-rich domain-containing protein n=1 Tax=Pseudotamlana agarivorans TaxID=481183 RepID=UPI00082F0B25|nr:trypsin inhibitor-like cysteine-rich domain-containing protein [Tamlana agarivorans]